MKLELVEAEGRFVPAEYLEKAELAELGGALNLVIDYDKKSLKARKVADFKLPVKKVGGRRFGAVPSGGRSAVIRTKDAKYENLRLAGVKIKGCRYLDMPPLPILYTEKKDGLEAAEGATVFDADGNKKRTFIEQPAGLLASDAAREVEMTNYAFSKGVPVSVIGLGSGEYEGVLYERNGKAEQLGTFLAGLLCPDGRVEEISLSRRDKKLSFMPEREADVIVDKLKGAAEEAGVGVGKFVYDLVFEGSGRVLGSLHSAGLIHGPRQSHLLNYTRPQKNGTVRVCDLGGALFAKDLSPVQAERYMANDLGLLMHNSAEFYFSVGSALGTVAADFDRELYAEVVRNKNPADYVIRGYTDGKMKLGDVPPELGGVESAANFIVSRYRK